MFADLPSDTADKAGSDSLLHASCVAFDGRAVLISGESGRGKSALALQLIAMGALLVADDRTLVRREEAEIIASCPETIRGKIEARGVGILRAQVADSARVALVVDLSREESDRMPHPHDITLLGVRLPIVLNVPYPHFPAAIRLMLLHGRAA